MHGMSFLWGLLDVICKTLLHFIWTVWTQFVPHGTDGWSFLVGVGWGIIIVLGVSLMVGMCLSDSPSTSTWESRSRGWHNLCWDSSDDKSHLDSQLELDDKWCRQAEDWGCNGWMTHPRTT